MPKTEQLKTAREKPQDCRRRRLLLGASSALAVSALPGSAWAQQSALVAGGPAVAAPGVVTLSVPGPGGSVSMPLELAIKIGADKAEGLLLRLTFVNGGGVAIADLLSGNAQFGVFRLPAALNSNLKAPRLVALAAVDDLPLYTLMVRADLRGKIRRIADLKGRVLGVHSDTLATKTTAHQLADLVLRSQGVEPADVSYLAAGQSWQTQSSAFRSGAVDASMCDEPFGARLVAEGLAFELFSTGNPADAAKVAGAGFLRAALISRRDLIEADAALAARMVRVVQRSLAWIATHTPEAAADLLAYAGAERKAFLDVLRKYPRQYSRDAMFSRAQLAQTTLFFRAQDPDNPAAQRYAIDTMIVDKWSGSKT